MAVANVPPGMAAAMSRAKAERDAMNSPDPVTRYRAKEKAMSDYAADYGRAAVAQAKETARQHQEQLRFYEQKNPYKPLPKWAKVSK